MKFEIKKGDITTEDVDAIVNAANSHLAHGGGVAAAIARAAGEALIRESNAIDYVPTGSCALTIGGNLPAKYVIHAVGPVYRDGKSGESELLASCITSSLSLAESKNIHSIAFPAISTGIFGYPIHKATHIMLSSALNYFAKHQQSVISKVVFVLYSEDVFQIFQDTYKQLTGKDNNL